MIGCENCDYDDARLHYRLNPINWIPNEKNLCLPCGKRLGFAPVTFSRSMHANVDYGRHHAGFVG